MKAVAYRRCLPVTDPESLLDVELPDPVPGERDLLVRVHAVSVNPVDTKVRRGVAPPEGGLRVLGFDAAGVVEAVGPRVTRFRPGDAVFYAGSRIRPGTNSELHCVDERIVGRKPASLDFAQAAAMPLTAITAWEALFDRLQLRLGSPHDAGALLITAGAGGVGSIAIQLARRLTGARVIATASRPESRAQALALGAHLVVDHAQPLSEALREAGVKWVERIFSVSHTHVHFPELAKLVAPQGRICVIDDPEPIDVRLLKARCASLHWEAMFTRSGFETPDMIEQGRLLDEVAALVDAGTLRSTHAQTFGRIDAATLRAAHAQVESGRTIGKVVLAGF
ncbi:MAG: zinc-binding alcohol dehydrogenase family protein [Burkholderiales bacterium]|nr:MAG: zinc-binding alcohol dehydrogenase family protein [Burkholderiales bacterium]